MNKLLDVCQINDLALVAPALKHSGGMERYTRDVIAGLHRMGLVPVLFARDIDESLEEAQWVDMQPLNVRWAPRKLRNWAYDWRLGRRLRKYRPQYVLGINHTSYADISICGGTHPGSLEAAGRNTRCSDAWQIALERRTHTNAQIIVAHSKLMGRELQRFYGLPAEKIKVLYPPVDIARFRPLNSKARLEARRRLGLPEDRIVFAFSSTSHKRKGYALLEKFFSRTDLPICLAVAGRPVGKTSDTIRYIGYCRDIENFFGAADYTVIASEYEPFGLVGVESVMCGTPLVIADNVGSCEAVKEEAKIEFSRRDLNGLGQAVHRAVARVLNGEARIAHPRQCLVYEPSVDAHVAALCELMISLKSK